jgi:TetR/AcrR family transcriptional regulator, transcriptional repressor for nem operon
MARPREFDPDTVLERAMRVFWAKGYHASSLDDLCDAAELNRPSLYAAFGDKRALFLATLDRYGDRAVARVTAALSHPVPIRDAIAAFLTEMIEQIVAGPGRAGCFIGNCAAEVAPNDRAAAACVTRNLKRVEAAFHAGFAAAKSRGEFSPETDIDALAKFFVASTQGLRLVGRTTGDRKTLDAISRVMLRCLD